MDLVTVLSIVVIGVMVVAATILAILFVRFLRTVEEKFSSRRSSQLVDNIQTFPAQIPSEIEKSKEGRSKKLGPGGYLFIFSIVGTIVLVISTIFSTRNFNIRRDAAIEFLALASNWPIVLEEPFDQNEIGWNVGEFSNELLVGDQKITDGKYFDSYENEQAPTGKVGLAESLPAAGEEATIEFDNFVLRAP